MSKKRPKGYRLAEIKAAFDPEALAVICEIPEEKMGEAYGLDTYKIEGVNPPYDFFHFADHGSNILFVAHLDTVARRTKRKANVFETPDAGWIVYSRALDDRLGAYVGLELLPKLGVQCDILLTTGEEAGRSTGTYFTSEKQYNWIIEFDRGGTDVVMYQYHDYEMRQLVEATGAEVGHGIFSDISTMDHLGCKAFNWGVGYREYHYAQSHAYLNDTFKMVDHFLIFWEANKDFFLKHEEKGGYYGGGWGGHYGGGWGDDDYDAIDSGKRGSRRGGWSRSQYDEDYVPWWEAAAGGEGPGASSDGQWWDDDGPEVKPRGLSLVKDVEDIELPATTLSQLALPPGGQEIHDALQEEEVS